ncbi:MAG TPA: LacI family DNA-binding transcriptional regulator [Candidatus Ruthenibacterium merdigallinarum]|nr:LacI family DNA-binding transcriptional regulator [Candidatus Ruthenibacterium merdigallinarum]
MDKRITIKEIAQLAGVSIGTVHCALNGKKGVSEATRQKILAIARQYAYQPNSLASSLKRKPVRIAAVFPGRTEGGEFYFSWFWRAVRDAMEELKDFNIELTEAPYYHNSRYQAAELEALLQGEEIDGLITATGYLDTMSKQQIQQFIDSRVPVALAGEDLPDSGRLCCVQPCYEVIGAMAAETLTQQAKGGDILVCAGDLLIPSHYKIVHGLENWLAAANSPAKVYTVYQGASDEEYYRHILRVLREEDIRACFCVTAAGSPVLARAIRDARLAGKVAALGSDLFEENVAQLRAGVFTGLVNKNPYSQARIAFRLLSEYLLRGVRPPARAVNTGSEIVLCSSLPMYEQNDYKHLYV